MKINQNSVFSPAIAKISICAFSVFFILGCEERKVGTAPKAETPKMGEAKVPTKTSKKSKGGEFKTTDISSNAFAITPNSGFKINVEYPWKMAAVDSGVKVGEIKLDEEKATIALTLPESAAGKKDVKIKGDFSVCNEEKCLIYRDEELNLRNLAEGASQK